METRVARQPGTPEGDAYWRRFLTEGDPMERAGRRFFRWLPHSPRCGLCLAPFAGAGAPLMRVLGKRPSSQNPNVCTSCFTHVREHRGGAEIELSLLFADIRGSTTLAEGMSAGGYRALLDRFYGAAGEAVFGEEGAIDKFVGDEVVAFFVPAFMRDREHARRAVTAARNLLLLTGHDRPEGPWVPVGAGVHSGTTWMGTVGEGNTIELTAVGDVVNVTARLASTAMAGEILVSVDAASSAGLDPSLSTRSVELRGKTKPTEVVTLTVGAEPT
jgi:adenylate cyclase